jgi:hypothetical protein
MYRNVIDDNITWHVSSNNPPTTFRTYTQVPVVESIRPLPRRAHSRDVRRSTKGDLVFSVNETHGRRTPSGKKQFAEGEVLEFGDVNVADIAIPPSNKIEARHNTNILDLESLGLEEEQVSDLYSRAMDTRESLDERYQTVRSQIEDLESLIRDTQKSINEVNKAIAAVAVIGDESIESSLNNKLESLQTDLHEYVTQHEAAVAESESIMDQIRQINEMVR